MPWRETVEPVRMQRVALLAPSWCWRDVLVSLADAGLMQVDSTHDQGVPGLQQSGTSVEPRLTRTPLGPDPDGDPSARREDSPHQAQALAAGEAELARVMSDSARRGSVAALTGWVPSGQVEDLAARLQVHHGALVRLATPVGIDPPTLLRTRGQVGRSFEPLVRTYATVPYADLDPTVLAGLAYVLMFGMMFADAGHGLLLILLGVLLRTGRPRLAARFTSVWPFVVGAGLVSTLFGVLLGEFFGPTGVLEPIWLDPLEEPVTLLAWAVGAGAVLLAVAYTMGAINRWREHGWRVALVAANGLAGIALFLGLGLVAAGLALDQPMLRGAGTVVGVAGLVLTYLGLFAAAGGGGTGAAQAGVEVFDAVIRLGTSLVSFARLAAFGLAHAALTALVWSGTTALLDSSGAGAVGVVAGIAVFVLGNAAVFAFEALVAGIQALRLEYYELFSRVFETEGRPFEPWHIPELASGYAPAAPGTATAVPTAPTEVLL